jgi:hypothetical protein
MPYGTGSVTRAAVRSYRTFSPLPRTYLAFLFFAKLCQFKTNKNRQLLLA